MPTVVVGRSSELASIRDSLARGLDAPSFLVLEGAAGMGKTTLWAAGVELAESQGALVLRARPAEGETSLSFSALRDLLEPVALEGLDLLPLAQRQALARALLLDDAAGSVPDPYAVGVAVLNTLRGLARLQPIVVAVDDVQWLDAASLPVLVYAVRRVRDERLVLLLARRRPLPSPLVDEARRVSAEGALAEVEVGPLAPEDVQRVLRHHLGVSLPRSALLEVHRASGGGPLFALEIQRTLRRTGAAIEHGKPLPVPESMQELIGGRLLALPAASREYVLAAAACSNPTTSLVETASGVSRRDGLIPALEAQILELEGNRIRFTHPLLAASVYETADPLRRVEIHACLAELLDDPEGRALHLAASVDGPRADVADALEEAALHAVRLGALQRAALLLDRAAEMTPADSPDRARRVVDASLLHLESGDLHMRFAEGRIRALIDTLPTGPERTRALLVLGRILSFDALDDAIEVFAQVIDDAGDDPATAASAHIGLASCLYLLVTRLEESRRYATRAFELALEAGDDALAGAVLVVQLGVETLLASPAASHTADRAMSLQERSSGLRLSSQPNLGVVVRWIWTDAHVEARAALLEMLDEATELGDEASMPYLSFLLGATECLLGDLASAEARTVQGLEAAELSSHPAYEAQNRSLQSYLHAQRGNDEGARAAARRALELAPGNGLIQLITALALGHSGSLRQDPRDVVEQVEPALQLARREGIAEPAAIRFATDLVEALVELARTGEAIEILDWYEANALRLGRTSALASCARCRGLLTAQAGDLEAAIAWFEGALALHGEVDLPVDRGRTLLALGVTQRRANHRRAARCTLETAIALFDRLGAAGWAERARHELRRVSGRATGEDVLTPTERRIAALVATGRTNREVASALFVSDRTVEWHLSHVYAKLGISRRSQLHDALAARQTPGDGSPNPGDTPVSARPAAS